MDDPALRDMDGELRYGAVSDIGCDEFFDEDGDQLPSYMENGSGHIASDYAMGSNPLNPDTDGDGFRDNDEWWADTDPNQSGSCLRFSQIANEGPAMRLYWQGGARVIQYLEASYDEGREWLLVTTLYPPTATVTNFPVGEFGSNVLYRIRTWRE